MSSVQSRIRGIYSTVRDFFLTGVWALRLEELPRWQAASIRALRALTAAVSEFFTDQCMLRASALTFYTLLSIVPVFAVVFGIAKGFGLEKLLEQELMEQMAGQEQALERILTFSRNMLENTQGGLIAGVGVVLMFWSAVKVLGQIESALNAMLDVRRQRSWVRRFSDYLAVMLIAPILLLAAGSASVFIRTQFDAFTGRFEIVGFLAPLALYSLRLTPLILVWALFTLLYVAMPNTRVRFGPAAVGAAVAGFLYQLVQWLYIDLQVGVAKQNAIYGSFAALPLFLAWVQASWTIVLFGAELCYAIQHGGDACQAFRCPAAGLAERKLTGLYIVHNVVQRFAAGEPPMSARELALKIKLPPGWVEDALAVLTAARILSETRRAFSEEPGYQPGMDIGLLTLQRVSEALESGGSSPESLTGPFEENAKLRAALRELDRAAAESPYNRLLKDL
jgi:membrane protein